MVRQEQQNPIRNRSAEQGKSFDSKLSQSLWGMFGFRAQIGIVDAMLLVGTGINANGAVQGSQSGLAASSPSAQRDLESIIDRWRDLMEWFIFLVGAERMGDVGDDNQNMLIGIALYSQNGIPQGLSAQEVAEAQHGIAQLFDLTNKRNDLDPLIKGDFMDMLQAALVDLGG